MDVKKRNSFTGTIGFVLAAAGSAIGLGNIWRFPYLAAKDGGGVFLLVYLIFVLTFGFTLLTTEVAIGRKTQQSALTAYGVIEPRAKWMGAAAYIVPAIILPYYCTIGGWVTKYLVSFTLGAETEADGFFTSFISGEIPPVVYMLIFLAITSYIIYSGVNKGIEKYSKIIMPVLFILIVGISLFSLTLKYTDADGTVRTGLDGLKVYIIPDFSGMTLRKMLIVIMDAMGQMFFSISVAMGIMVTYGSYVKKDANLMQSINSIELFDTLAAFLAGLMIVPAVYTFMGTEGMSASGPSLIFVMLPKVFASMGRAGYIVGVAFFVMVLFAAVTSSVSIMETIVSGLIDRFGFSRPKSTAICTAYALIVGCIVCFGYNLLYFEVTLPNGTTAQILDIMDYVSNSCLMPFLAFCTCILIGWIVKPKTIIDEVKKGGFKFSREKLYIIMIKFVAPVMLFILLLQAFGLIV